MGWMRTKMSLPRPQEVLEKWLVLLMLLATLFPLYAPWLNHNFAAIQPGHQHLFVGEVAVVHHHASALAELLPHPHEAPSSEVINLPNWLGRLAVMALPAGAVLLLGKLAEGWITAVFEDMLAVSLVTQRQTTPPPR